MTLVKEIISPPMTAKIWRYMDFAKLMSLIDRSALFFPIIKAMPDKFDGSMAIVGWPVHEQVTNHPGKTFADIENDPDGHKSTTVVSCWHMNESESTAMWSQYAPQNAGFAIQSTVQSLLSATNFSKFDPFYRIGLVQYGHYENTPVESFSFGVIDFFKRQSFSHEQEVRVIISPRRDSPEFLEMRRLKGLFIEMNLSELIKEIWVGPFTPDWFEELIDSIVNRKYKLNIAVVRSKIDKDPSIP